jgi:hypothetical protein
MILAKKIEVFTIDGNFHPDNKEISFIAYKFSNGLILVPGDTTSDWFFPNEESIQACGNDVLVRVEDLGINFEWEKEELLLSFLNSVEEFGEEQGTKILIKDLCLMQYQCT